MELKEIMIFSTISSFDNDNCDANQEKLISRELSNLDLELICACVEGDVEKFNNAIDHGANVLAVDERGNTGLIYSSIMGHSCIVAAILPYATLEYIHFKNIASINAISAAETYAGMIGFDGCYDCIAMINAKNDAFEIISILDKELPKINNKKGIRL